MEVDVLKRFGERVRYLRKQAGFPQDAFADLGELDRTCIGVAIAQAVGKTTKNHCGFRITSPNQTHSFATLFLCKRV